MFTLPSPWTESAPSRTARDFGSSWRSRSVAWWYGVLTAVLGVIGQAVSDTDPMERVLLGIGAFVVAAAIVGVVLVIGIAVRTPFRQRDEARREVERRRPTLLTGPIRDSGGGRDPLSDQPWLATG